MSDLPDGWEWAFIGDVAQIQGGIQKQQRRRPVKNKYPFLRVANVLRARLDIADLHEVELFEGEFDKLSLRRGDLLVVEGNGSPGHIGRAARWNGEVPNAVHQNHLIRVRPESGLDGQYLEYLWNSKHVIDQLVAVAGSTNGLLTLSVSKLKRVKIPLPPLAEQRRISGALDGQLPAVDSGRAQINHLLRRVDRFRDDVYTGATSGSLATGISAGLADLPSYAGAVDGELPRLPATWTWRRLGEIAEVVGGATKDTKRQSDLSVSELPYLRVANVQRGRLDLSDVATMRIDPEKARRLTLEEGDVLLNEGGDRDKLGRGWIWEGQIASCVHQNHVFRVRIQNDLLDPRLLAWHANGFGRGWFFRNGKQSTNLASISLSTMKLLPVPVPPAGEQEGIVKAAEKQLSMLDAVEQRLLRTRGRVAQLRQSLLREAFAGRLVPQDPDDEPASAVLERIRAERESAPKTKAPRKKRAGKSGASETQQYDKNIDPSTSLPEAPGKGTQDALELDL